MGLDDRPDPDPATLQGQLGDWQAGEVPPGRMLAFLQTGGLADALAGLGAR